MMSDWWTHVLVGATPEAPNLDHPTNVATLQRIAARYDLLVIVDPFWHTVGSQARDRIRSYAQAQGRNPIFLRYMGSMYLRWHDQPGDMGLVPAVGRVSYTGVVSNSDTMLKSGGTPMRGRIGTAHLLDPGSSAALTAAQANAVTKAAGWDGIFIDEVVDYYTGFRENNTQTADGYPLPPSLTYPNAKRDFVAAVTSHVVSNGKLVGANITPYVLPGGGPSYPQQVCAAAPGLLYPFTEAEFGADWDRTAIGTTSVSWPTQMDIAGWLTWCHANGRRAIPNVYSNDPAVVRYGLGLFLAHAGPSAFFSAACPEADENEEYMREPTWVSDIDDADRLGAPAGPAAGTNLVTRKYAGGRVAVNPTASVQTLTVDGYYSETGETAKTTGNRAVPARAATVLRGDDFGTYRQVNGKKGRGLHMWGGGRWNRLVAPNEYTGPPLPTGTPIFSEAFTGSNGAAWDTTKWASGMALASSTATIVGNRGQLKVGTASPGVRTQRFTGQEFADFHALLTFAMSSTSTALTVVFRSGDTTLDEVDAYGLRLWHDRDELIHFDSSYTGTIITQSPSSTRSSGLRFYLRLKASGSRIQARSWLTDDTEPTAWGIDVTNSARTAAGWFGFSVSGFGASGPNTTATVDDLTVATS